MGFTKAVIASALCATMALSGCSVQELQQIEPASVDDCRDNWKIERGVSKIAVPAGTTNFDAMVLRFLSSFARQTSSTSDANRRYRMCLMTFGVTNTDDFESAARQGDPNAPYLQRLAPRKPVNCPPGASVLYGGAGYCVGRR